MTERGAAGPAGGGRTRRAVVRLGLLALFLTGLAVAVPSGFGLLWFVPYAGVGSLLVARRPESVIGPILLGIGWALACAALTLDVTVEMYADGTLDPMSAALSVVTASAGMAGFYLFAVLALVFPTGRLPDGRWRPVARMAIAAGLLVLLASLVMPTITVNVWGESVSQPVPNPAAVLPRLGLWSVVTPDTVALPLATLMAGAVLSLLARFRSSRGIERRQMKWLASALAFVVVAVVGGFVLGLLRPDLAESGVVWLGAVVAFPLVPTAIGLAVLRHRLYEIDRLVSRTVAWLALTAVLGTLFAALVVGLQAALEPATGGETLAVAVSTLIAAVLFQPLRRRVQAAVDRRFNRGRYDAERVAAGFAGRIRDRVEVESVVGVLDEAVGLAVQPSAAAVWIRGGAR